MSRAALSIFVFGVYFSAAGAVLMLAPNALLVPLHMPPTHEPWLRVLGIVAFVLGLYYVAAARANVVAFFRFSTWGRSLFMIGAIAFVALDAVPWQVLLFGAVDVAGAIWTRLALRSAS